MSLMMRMMLWFYFNLVSPVGMMGVTQRMMRN